MVLFRNCCDGKEEKSCAEGIKMGRLNALISWALVLMTAFYL
jgi:hypothetical protein